MGRSYASKLTAFAAIVLIQFPTAADNPLDAYLQPGTLVTLPDGRHFHMRCMGAGAPVAILDAGWGDWSTTWRALQPSLAQITRVCAVDRAGYGFSDPGPLPRDAAATVADFEDAFKAANIAPPFILVGHSLGGFNVRLFAYRNPADTAGLLLIDPPTEQIYRRERRPDEDLDEVKRCLGRARAGQIKLDPADDCVGEPSKDWSPAMRVHQMAASSNQAYFETQLSEDESMVGSSADELFEARRPLGRIPLVILQAGEAPADVTAELAEQARDSRRGRRDVVLGTRHYIQVDKPDTVVSAFREILEASRR